MRRLKFDNLSRRNIVKGMGAAGAAATLGTLFGANAASAAVQTLSPGARQSGSALSCSEVHRDLSDKLTAIVGDPNVSKADTSLALRTTFCPHCNTQINASYPIVPWAEIGKAYG